MTTQEPLSRLEAPTQDQSIFQQIEDYPWDSDAEFQGGLQAILGLDPSRSQAEHLTLRARCFYYSRKNNIPIDFNAYLAWRTRHSSDAPSLTNGSEYTELQSSPKFSSASEPFREGNLSTTNGNEPPAPYPTSFNQIVEMITSGQPIPGVRDVPDRVLDGQASQSTTSKRKKPWEKDNTLSGEGGLVVTHGS